MTVPTYEELIEALATMTGAFAKSGATGKGVAPLIAWAERHVTEARSAVDAVRGCPHFKPSRHFIYREPT